MVLDANKWLDEPLVLAVGEQGGAGMLGVLHSHRTMV